MTQATDFGLWKATAPERPAYGCFPTMWSKTMGPDHGERLLSFPGNSPDPVFQLIETHGIECEAVRSGTLHCARLPGGFHDLQKREEPWGRATR